MLKQFTRAESVMNIQDKEIHLGFIWIQSTYDTLQNKEREVLKCVFCTLTLAYPNNGMEEIMGI